MAIHNPVTPSAKTKGSSKAGAYGDWIHELDGIHSFFRHFDYRWISCDKGFTKYDAEFYAIPSAETGIEPRNILLVDDKQRVIDMAESAGMNGHLFTSVSECRDFLMSLAQQGILSTEDLL